MSASSPPASGALGERRGLGRTRRPWRRPSRPGWRAARARRGASPAPLSKRRSGSITSAAASPWMSARPGPRRPGARARARRRRRRARRRPRSSTSSASRTRPWVSSGRASSRAASARSRGVRRRPERLLEVLERGRLAGDELGRAELAQQLRRARSPAARPARGADRRRPSPARPAASAAAAAARSASTAQASPTGVGARAGAAPRARARRPRRASSRAASSVQLRALRGGEVGVDRRAQDRVGEAQRLRVGEHVGAGQAAPPPPPRRPGRGPASAATWRSSASSPSTASARDRATARLGQRRDPREHGARHRLAARARRPAGAVGRRRARGRRPARATSSRR